MAPSGWENRRVVGVAGGFEFLKETGCFFDYRKTGSAVTQNGCAGNLFKNAARAERVFSKLLALHLKHELVSIAVRSNLMAAAGSFANEMGKAFRDRKSTRLNSSHIPLSRMPS